MHSIIYPPLEVRARVDALRQALKCLIMASVAVLALTSVQAGLTSVWDFEAGTSSASPNGLGATLALGPADASITKANGGGHGGADTYSLELQYNSSGSYFTINLNPQTLSGLSLSYWAATSPGAAGSVSWYYSLNSGAYQILFNPPHEVTATWTQYSLNNLSTLDYGSATSLTLKAQRDIVYTSNAIHFDDITLTAVPEPANGALAGFGLLVVGLSAGRFYLSRRSLHHRAPSQSMSSYVILLALGLAAVSGRAQSGGTTNAPDQGAKIQERGPKRAERVWTRTDGVKLTGVFVARHGSVLALKEAGGRNVFWSWAQVSQADRDYLAREKAVFGPHTAPVPAPPPSRQELVSQRMTQVAARAGSAPAPAEAAPPASAAESNAVGQTTEPKQ